MAISSAISAEGQATAAVLRTKMREVVEGRVRVPTKTTTLARAGMKAKTLRRRAAGRLVRQDGSRIPV